MHCYFVSDLHGNKLRYEQLFHQIQDQPPDVVFMGGDLLPSGIGSLAGSKQDQASFIDDFFIPNIQNMKTQLGNHAPEFYLILGNDDGRFEEARMIQGHKERLWNYCHNQILPLDDYYVIGYSYSPPSPFQLKDWERYDLGRYTDPGCIPIEAGLFSIPVSDYEKQYTTIFKDLQKLCTSCPVPTLEKTLWLFHAPPHNTKLDLAAIKHAKVDHAPLDPHVGSTGIRRFIDRYQPYITLHGHIHEASRLTGAWHQQLGSTHAFNAAVDKPVLSIIHFCLDNPEQAERVLVTI